MAFVQSPIDPNEQNQNSPQGQTTSNPLALLPPQATQTGGSSGQGGGSASQTVPGQGSPTQFGTSASKLSDYLKANQDQVQNMANQIAGNLNAGFTTAQSDINTAGQNFASTVASSYTPPDPSLNTQVSNNPTSAAANPSNVSEFQSELNDQYTGPTSFEGSTPYQNVQSEVNNAVQQAGLTNSPSGLGQYLQNNVETNPTQGENTLDTVLLQGNPQAVQTVQQAAAPYSTLTGFLSDVAGNEDQSVQVAEQNAQAAQQGAQGALNTAATNLTNTVNAETSAADQAANTYNNVTFPQAESIAQQDLALLGQYPGLVSQYGIMTPGTTNLISNEPTFGSPNLTQLLGGQAIVPTASEAATPADYQTASALEQLAGPTLNLPISPAEASQSGAITNPAAPNYQPLESDLQTLQTYLSTTPWQSINQNFTPSQAQTAIQNYYAQLGGALNNLYTLSAQEPAAPVTLPPGLPPITLMPGGGGPMGGKLLGPA